MSNGSAQVESKISSISAADELKSLRQEVAVCRAELKASMAELERFIYGAAHDLSGPLTRAYSSCQVLLEDHQDQLNHEARRWVALAIHHVEHTQRRVAALRRLSEVLTEAQPSKPIDANLAFQEAAARLATQIAHRAANVSCGPLGSVWADGTQFTLLLENLIDNGLRFAGNEVPAIEVGRMPHWTSHCSQVSQALKTESDTHPLALFFVRDNSVGIAAANLESIFLPFHQLQPPAERIGDGIGLALCQRIVKRHGGTIWAESTVGAGSVFYFTMPTL